MAFKLTRDELKQKQEHIDKLTESFHGLEAAIEIYNSGLSALRDKLREEISTYNDSLSEAKDFMADIASDRDSEFSDKSERWQEGEKGQAAQEWYQEWENAELDEFDPELPDDIEFNGENPADVLDQLQDEASS